MVAAVAQSYVKALCRELPLQAVGAQACTAIAIEVFNRKTSQVFSTQRLYYPISFALQVFAGCLLGASLRVSLLSSALLTGVSCTFSLSQPNSPDLPIAFGQTKAVSDWLEWSAEELEKVIQSSNKAFQSYENQSSPPGGYQLVLFEEKGPWSLSAHDQRKRGAPLMGSPAVHAMPCSLCSAEFYALSSKFNLVRSLSNRPLIIDIESPTVNWFQMTHKAQLEMLLEAQKFAKKLKSITGDKTFSLEFHCGAPGAQTVWHTHLRFNRSGGWGAVQWWNKI